MLTVMIVDDQEAFRRITRASLDKKGDFQVVAEAANGWEAVSTADEVEPDLVIMDVQMPEMNGLEATREIIKRRPGTRVVLVSVSEDREYMRMGLEVGAVAFIPKRHFTGAALRQALDSPQSPPTQP